MTTSGRVDGWPILAIQDTTSFRDDGSGNSLVGPATIAVEAEPGTLLGAVDMQLIDRSGGGPKPPKNRPLRDKESHRWLETMQTSATVRNAAAYVTVVAAREADIFEMFAGRPEGVDLRIRASHGRCLCDDTGKLFSRLEGRPQPEHTVAWSARPGQKKRTARMGVRFACVTLKTQGFDIANVSVETAPFQTLCARTFIAGISCRPLVPDRDDAGQRPLKDVFEAPDQPVLEAVSASLEGPTDKPKNPHPRGALAFAAWVCARLGGGTGYYGKPGPVVMLRGRYQFQAIQLG